MKGFSKVVVFFMLCFLLIGGSAQTVFAESADISNNDDGTVRIRYNNTYDTKVKLLVQLTGGKQYKYDIPKGNVDIKIPLTQGNGDYKFILCRNITGTRYAVMQTINISQKLTDSTSAYLTSNYMISWEENNKAIKHASSLAKKNKGNKIKVIYEYVVKNYSYDYKKSNNIDELSKGNAYIPNINSVYSEKKGICYDISILLASMLRSVGVPTKVVTGYTPNANVYHAWNNVYEKSKWNIIDATYDLQLYKAGKKYKMYKDYNDYKDVVYTY